MKGCLSIVIKTIIAILVFFGLLHLGVIDFIKDKINEHKANIEQKAEEEDVVDLSEIDDEYAVDKDLKVLRNRMIIAEHKATGQKMIMIEPRNEDILTKEDITSGNIQQKLDDIVSKYKNKVVKFDRVEVTKRGEFKGINQTIPYVKVNAEISNLPIKGYEGILGVAELKNGKNLIVLSVNQSDKYSQIITDAFYTKVK